MPERVSFSVDVERPSALWTSICGFPVSLTLRGEVSGTVFTDPSGDTIIAEIDTQPGTRRGFKSASGSFDFPFATAFHFEYPNGAEPGRPAIVTATGLGDKVPGISAEAGKLEFSDAVVVAVVQNIPIVDFGLPTSGSGHLVDEVLFVKAVCSALS
jgi:hypothetical protein